MSAPVITLTHRYRPRGTCAEVFRRRNDEVLVSGPAGTGKSRACMEKLNYACLLTPKTKALIVRKTAASLGSSALATFEQYVVPELMLTGDVHHHGGSTREPPGYRYSNGSLVSYGGLDKPSKIMSTEYDLIYVQEATELDIEGWEALTTRLRNGRLSFQQLVADCNPGPPWHWLKKRAEEGALAMLTSTHEDNPVLFDDDGRLTVSGREYLAKLDALTGVRYLRLRKGLWVAAEGIIYEDFDPAVHVVEPFDPPQSWARYWSVDFGFKNPFVCQFWAEDEDGRLWLYRELYFTERIVADHARQILNIVAPDGEWLEPKPTRIICDHDAEDRATLEREVGMKTHPATKTVSDGIQAMQRRLRKAGDGRPRMFVMRGCTAQVDRRLAEANRPTSTEQEFVGYVWDTRDGKPPLEVPLKENDHGMDAARYLVAERDLKNRRRGTWL